MTTPAKSLREDIGKVLEFCWSDAKFWNNKEIPSIERDRRTEALILAFRKIVPEKIDWNNVKSKQLGVAKIGFNEAIDQINEKLGGV